MNNINNYVDLRNRNSFGYDGVIMFKLVLLAFANKGYCSTRDLADLCRFDIRYKFIAQVLQPSHSSFQRFLHDDVKGFKYTKKVIIVTFSVYELGLYLTRSLQPLYIVYLGKHMCYNISTEIVKERLI